MRRASVIAGLIASAMLVLLMIPLAGPRYQGRSAREWLHRLMHTNDADRVEAAAAVRKLDTNVIPILTQRLGARDSALQSNVTKLLRKQSLVPVPASPALEARLEGLKGFEALGKSAIPELTKLLDDPLRAKSAAWLLSQLDDSVIPVLLIAITNCNSEVRSQAALDLGYRHTNAPGVVPALMERLKVDSDPMTRTICASALGKIPDLPDD